MKFLVSSPARRPTFSRCWIRSRRALREYAVRTMHSFASLKVIYSICARITDKSNLNLPRALLIVTRYLADPFLIANSFISMTCWLWLRPSFLRQ